MVSPRILLSPSCALALGFGAGLSPWMPGTAGAILGLPLHLALRQLPWMAAVAVLAVLLIAGSIACGRAGKILGKHDHGAIVWDEVYAMLVILYAVPVSSAWWIAALVVFRFFDIVKPWPIRVIDRRMTGGFAVMADDLAAAIASMAVLTAARWMLGA